MDIKLFFLIVKDIFSVYLGSILLVSCAVGYLVVRFLEKRK